MKKYEYRATSAKKYRNDNVEIDYSKVIEHNGKHAFDFYDPIKRKTFRFCTEIRQSLDVDCNYIYHRCSYNIESSKFVFNHICSFDLLLPANFQLPSYFFAKTTVIDKKISDLIGKLVIDLNLSFKAGASCEMKDFITEILMTGYNIAKKEMYPSAKCIPQPKYSEKTLRTYVLKESARINEQNKKSIQKLGTHALTLDAGTIDSKKSLFYCIANPSQLSKHIFIGSDVMDHEWGTEDYRIWGKEMIEKYPNLSAFVGDGLPAGVAGLAHFKPDSATYYDYRTVFFINCNNHILNKAFEKACRNDDALKITIKDLDTLTALLRKSFVRCHLQNIKTPAFPKTRWLYVFDALLWITQRRDKINNALRESRKAKTSEYQKFTNILEIPDSFSYLLDALKPIKKLQLAFENEKVGLPFVYPFLIYTIRKYQIIIDSTVIHPNIINFAKTILHYIIEEFKEKARIPLLVYSFALSPLGVNYISGTDLDHLFDGTVKKILGENEPLEPNNSELDFEEEEEESLQAPESITPPKDEVTHYIKFVMEKKRDQYFITEKVVDSLNENVKLPTNLIFSPSEVLAMAIDVFKNKEMMREIKIRGNCEDWQRAEVVKHVGKLEVKLMQILKRNDDVPNIEMLIFDEKDMYGYAFYNMLLIKHTEYALIAMSALQMMSIPAGESSCERAISKARFICGDHSTKTRDELRCAKILTCINAQMSHGLK